MEHAIAPGFCQCGCGKRTSICKQSDPKRGYKKGDYKRFVNQHHIPNMQPGYKPNIQPKICMACGKEFLPNGPARQNTQTTCSSNCRNAYTARKTVSKRAEKQRERGEGKTYRKLNGRHKHRVIMEQILGRPLKPSEIVHHKDGNILNNDPLNLELLKSKADHSRLHIYRRLERRGYNGETSCDTV